MKRRNKKIIYGFILLSSLIISSCGGGAQYNPSMDEEFSGVESKLIYNDDNYDLYVKANNGRYSYFYTELYGECSEKEFTIQYDYDSIYKTNYFPTDEEVELFYNLLKDNLNVIEEEYKNEDMFILKDEEKEIREANITNPEGNDVQIVIVDQYIPFCSFNKQTRKTMFFMIPMYTYTLKKTNSTIENFEGDYVDFSLFISSNNILKK